MGKRAATSGHYLRGIQVFVSIGDSCKMPSCEKRAAWWDQRYLGFCRQHWENGHLHKIVITRSRSQSGQDLLWSECERCLAQKRRLPNREWPADWVSLPIVQDHVDRTPCDHCGDTNGVEYHHYAPKALFDDPNSWPVGPLCRECHTFWHNTIRNVALQASRVRWVRSKANAS